jgi:hypothetical protein
MTDMRKVAGDLYSLANGMDKGGDPLRAVRAAQKVMGRDVRVALIDPPANLGNCNKGRRLMDSMSRAFGKVEGGNTNPINVAACASVMRDIAGECSKW